MKKSIKPAILLLLALSMILMFVPSFDFNMSESAVASAQEDVVKLQTKADDAQAKYDSMAADGDPADKLSKQQVKADKALQKLEEGKLNLERIIHESTGSGKSLSIFNAGLPQGLEVNRQVINENNNIYKEEVILRQFSPLAWASIALMLISILCVLFAPTQRPSSLYSLSALSELAAIVTLSVIILRQLAFPIKAPYEQAAVNFLAYLPMLMLITSVMIKSLSMLRVKRSMIYLISILLSVLSIFPFYIMIINATRNTYQIQQGLSLLPGSAFMSNWDILMNKNFNVLTGLKNSAIISVGSTVLSVYFSSLAAYGLIVYDFKWKNALFSFIVGIIMIPAQVSAIGFYLYMYRIGWVDSYLPLIIPAIASPATVFFMRQYLKANFQISLVEAARIDGARELFTFNRIVLPIMMPAMATMAIFGFITSWNNYLTPLMLLKNPDMATLPMMVRTLRGDIYRTEYGSIYLGLSLTAAPLLIVYFSLSKYIIQGVALGGVKE